MRQVFHNLISNSVEAIGRNSPDPFICLTAELQMQNGTATGVRVTLTDNGDLITLFAVFQTTAEGSRLRC